MKKILMTIVSLLMASIAMAATPNYVRVTPKSGEPVMFGFSQQPEISMLADGIRISATGETPVSFKFDEVDNIDFPATTEVADLEAKSIVVNAYSDRVTFSNLPENAGLRLFNIGGQLVKAFEGAPEVTLYKADFPSGIYIAVIGNTSFKIIL